MVQLATNALLSKAEAGTQHVAQASFLWGRRASRLPKKKTCGKLTLDVSDEADQDRQSLRIVAGR